MGTDIVAVVKEIKNIASDLKENKKAQTEQLRNLAEALAPILKEADQPYLDPFVIKVRGEERGHLPHDYSLEVYHGGISIYDVGSHWPVTIIASSSFQPELFQAVIDRLPQFLINYLEYIKDKKNRGTQGSALTNLEKINEAIAALDLKRK